MPVNCRLYLPPPLFVNVPIVAPVELTYTVSVAVALVLVASTRSSRSEDLYSARVTETESVVGGGVAGGGVDGGGVLGGGVLGGGVGAGWPFPFTPRLVLFVAPPPVPVIVTTVLFVTGAVLTLKFTKF